MFGILGKILDSNEKQVKKLGPQVEDVLALEEKFSKLSDAKLKALTAEFKLRLEGSETLNEILPEAYAAVREASSRSLNMKHFPVQILAGIVLHNGAIAEQKTGEGKTLTASLPLYLNSLTGRGVHLATVNDYLARVGLGWMGPIYSALGVSAGCVMQDAAFIYDQKYTAKGETDWRLQHLKPVSKKEAYEADITYGTNNEFGFDYLRDNMVWDLKDMAQRGHHFAIVDEADSILIDEARTPLIISAAQDQASDKYYQFSKLVQELSAATDYVIDEKLKTANLTEHGITKVEKRLGVANLYEKDFGAIHHIQQALRARTLYFKDKDYVVKDGEIIIVDEFTGRLMPGRRWSEGLHQAIEAKEGLSVQQESQTLATISFQNYFRLYEKLGGMTGTASTEAEEFHKIYKIEVITIPTNMPQQRIDHLDVVYKTQKAKFTAVANDVGEKNKAGQPVLIGTTSIEKNEFLSGLLKRKGIPHTVLNAKNHQKEAEIISQAGTRGTVTLATNIAGRGVDIILGGTPPVDKVGVPITSGSVYEKWKKTHEEVIELGGLHVVGTERHEARRIDNQLRGRSGRQGDPGSSHFYISLEDDIMRLFGGDQIARIMTAFKLPEDTPIEHGMVGKAIQNAQVKVETHNFDIRKHLVEYDDIANKQREIIYGLRRDALNAADDEKLAEKLSGEIKDKVDSQIRNLVLMNTADGYSEKGFEKIAQDFSTIIPFDETSLEKLRNDAPKNADKLPDFLISVVDQIWESREKNLSKKVARDIEKFVTLSVIDTLWIEHLDALDNLREGIGLRAAGQRDPLVEYKQEAFNLFEKLVGSVDYEIAHRIFKVQVNQPPAIEQVEQQGIEVHEEPQLLEQVPDQKTPEVIEANPLEMEDDELEREIARLEKEQGGTTQSTISDQQSVSDVDPAEMTDEQLDAEIARLERQQSGLPTQNPMLSGKPGGQPLKLQKIGRNDPCPCGSGLKFKKCGLINAPQHKG